MEVSPEASNRGHENEAHVEESIATPTELIGSSAYYNHEWKVLICGICKTSVNGEFVENHYKSNHKELKKKDRDQLITRFAELGLVISSPDSVRRPEPLEAYFSQLRLWPDYLACDQCNEFITKSEKYLDTHCNMIHNVKLSKGRAKTKRVRPYLAGLQVQSFFNKPEKWFIANTPHNRAILHSNTAELTENEPDQLNALVNAKSAYYQQLEVENEQRINDLFMDSDPKHIHQFLIRFHWRFWLRGKSISKLTEFGSNPSENDKSGNFLIRLAQFGWKKVETLLIEPPSRFILQIVNTQRFRDKGSEYEQRPFNALHKKATKDRYSHYWAEFVLIAFRIWKKEAFNIQFPEEIIHWLERIDQFGSQHGWVIHESDDDEFINSIIDKFNELVTHLLIHSISHDITQSTSIADQNGVNDKTFTNPIILWCIIQSFNESTGAFRSESDISNVFSAMIWNIKLFAVKYALLMDEEAHENQHNQDDPNSTRFHLHQFIEQFHKDWLNVDKFTVYQTIQQYRAYSRKMRQDAREGVIEDVNPDLIRYNGEKVKISELKSLIHFLTRRCADLLYNQLLFIHPDELHKQLAIDQLHDDNYESECGWWFMKSHKNPLKKYDTFLMERFLRINTELGNEWSRQLATGLELKPTKVDQWLRVRVEFLKELMNLLHISGGAPIRGSEIINITFRNSADLMRTIFIDLNKKAIRINSRYSKTLNVTGKDRPTIRFFPQNISQLIIHYLVIAIPFYHKVQTERKLSVVNEITGESEPFRSSDFLIEIDGKTPAEGVIGEWMRRNFSVHLNNNLTLKDFRHSIKFIMKTRILPNEDLHFSESDSDNEDLTEDKQSGHSTFTAQSIYSRPINIPLRITESEYTKAMRLSQQYHQFFQINSVNVNGIIAKAADQMDHSKKHRRELSEIQLAKRPRSNLNQQFIDSQLQLPHEVSDDPTFLKGKLREFLQDPRAKFRGHEQLEAIQLGLRGESRVVYVNGTGSGKSLVFFLSAYILPGKSHVVFAPLNALKENLVERARGANMKVTIWKADSQPMVDENVVFVSYEDLQTQSFTDWLKKKRRSDSIERIYIDEAHVIILQSQWRYIMRYMADVNFHEIPITFLTATFTREIEILLKREMKLPDLDTRFIRGFTKRRNIQYQVRKLQAPSYQTDAFRKAIIGAINGMVKKGHFSPNDLALIFSRGSKAKIQQLADEMGFEYYFSGRPNFAQVLTDFKAGKIRVMITTSALSLGLDLPNIRAVFHIGKSSSLTDFHQESGRAGRDGQLAFSFLMYGENEFQPLHDYQSYMDFHEESLNFHILEYNDEVAMNQYVNEQHCRRRLLNQKFDHLANQKCKSDEDHLCDLCRQRAMILSESATAQRQCRTNQLDRIMKLEGFLSELEEGCAWCVYEREFHEWKSHEIAKCPNRARSNEAEYQEFIRFTSDLGMLIRQKKMIQKGSACFGCWLPMKFCKRGKNNEKCVIRGRTGTRLVNFITFFYFIYLKKGEDSIPALMEIGSVERNEGIHEIAKMASERGIIHNTECIQAIHWVEEFDWDDWFKE